MHLHELAHAATRLLLAFVFASFCSSHAGQGIAVEDSRFDELGTKFGDSENSVAREVLMAPEKYQLDFPAFLVGIEKAKRENIGAPRMPELELGLRGWPAKYIDVVTFSNVPLPGMESRSGRMFVSHLVEFAPAPDAKDRYKATIRYSAYRKNELARARDAFEEGRRRLLELRAQLEKVIEAERTTHVIVFATGWNTEQSGTFDGIKRLHDILQKAAGNCEFRPLMIGISWPSMSERLAKPLSEATYNVKSCDADEVGLVWASTLVNQVLVPLRNDVRRTRGSSRRLDVIVLGHSFGTRVVTWTAFCGGLRPAVEGPVASAESRKGAGTQIGPDVVIGLQGAFSIARFVDGKGVEGGPWCQRPASTRFAYTCSEHDKANEKFNEVASPANHSFAALAARFERVQPLGKIKLGIPLIGGITAFRLDSEDFCRAIEHRTVADAKGNLDRPIPATNEKVLLIDASRVIKDKPDDRFFALLAGAHGDIYNESVGRLIWQIISAPLAGERQR